MCDKWWFAYRSEAGRRRPGYMGHLTRIANHLVTISGGDDVDSASEAANPLLLGQPVEFCVRRICCLLLTGAFRQVQKLTFTRLTPACDLQAQHLQ